MSYIFFGAVCVIVSLAIRSAVDWLRQELAAYRRQPPAPGNRVQVRPGLWVRWIIGHDDLDRVLEIEHQCFGRDSWTRKHFLSEFERGGYCCLAEQDNVLCGYVIYRRLSPTTLFITNLAVGLDWQRNGIGMALVGYVIERLRELNAEEIRLKLSERNLPMQKLLVKMGFQFEGIDRGWYDDTADEPLDAYEFSFQLPQSSLS